jgi:lysyl-tRNA synthetase class 2
MSPASRNNGQPSASLEVIKLRARMLQDIRAFFAARDVLEVETPQLSSAAVTDVHLHSFATRFRHRDYFLHTSPEFFMKRLLAAGSGDIYQLCKVFRDDEQGKRHNPEFTLLEWYRSGFDHYALMTEIETLFNSLLSIGNKKIQQPAVRVSYQQAFLNTLNIDPLSADVGELKKTAQQHGIEIPQGMDDDKDMWLDWLMVAVIAPSFANNQFTFIYDYPASQAALARLNAKDPRVAHRFEVFYGELELGNGFHELTDAREQRQRFEADNRKRKLLGLSAMPMDEHFLAALEQGLPECAGVAVGVDRLLMVLLNKTSIDEVMTFGFDRV